MIEIVSIDTPSLGDRSYLVTDGTVALVVDPQRDYDRVQEAAAERGVAISHVVETHIHNDYLTGGLALARATGAEYFVNGADPVRFDRTPVADGDIIGAGQLRLQVIATPGHTFTHLCYALHDGGQVVAAFTGGSLLNGSTGRTDLLGAEHKLALTKAQFGSAHRLAAELPDAATVCPTHGFGSFCSATATSGGPSTIGHERTANPALSKSEADYVTELLAGLDAYPAYYAHMGQGNLAGPAAPALAPPRAAEPAELRRRIAAGEWVVDLRARTAFAAGHLAGTVNFELGTSFATYLGWLIPFGAALTLIGDSAAEVAQAQRELCRIGVDRIDAAAAGGPGHWAAGHPLQSFPTADFSTLRERAELGGLVLLDVRRRSEWLASHLPAAINIPLHELAGRLTEVPDGEVWVHCQAGYRAAVAASMLAAAGRSVVAIDDSFDAARAAGLTTAAG